MKSLRTIAILAVIAAGVFVAVRYGGSSGQDMGGMGHGGGMSAAPTETRSVDMVDIAFSTNHLTVPHGSRVRFVFHNRGAVVHEAVIGDEATQSAHDKEMGAMTDMGHMHAANAVSVAPGGTGDLVYTFDRAGTVLIGCHQPGHYSAGMKATISVS